MKLTKKQKEKRRLYNKNYYKNKRAMLIEKQGEKNRQKAARKVIKDLSKPSVHVESKFLTREAVNHPPHYGGIGNVYEAIKVIEAWDLDFHLGNTVKYIARAGKKDDIIQDLEKAKWYLDRKIENLKTDC